MSGWNRRDILKMGGWAAVAGAGRLFAQTVATPQTKMIQTPVLDIAYEESGNPQGQSFVLLHGFPDDVRAWDGVVPKLVAAGHRVLVPYLRGYGPTRFLDLTAPRMAEQAALGQDLLDFMDALHLDRAIVSGYDWGARGTQVAAAVHPERIRAACFVGGYTIQNINANAPPGPPASERNFWYQWYFNIERGRAGLRANRRALCRLFWETWSPTWHFNDETFNRTAPSFDNPDFVDCVIHSYRHRMGNALGENRFEAAELFLGTRPKITVPTILLHGADDALNRPSPTETPAERALFPALVARRVVEGGGHFLPREKPEALASALLELASSTR